MSLDSLFPELAPLVAVLRVPTGQSTLGKAETLERDIFATGSGIN